MNGICKIPRGGVALTKILRPKNAMSERSGYLRYHKIWQ